MQRDSEPKTMSAGKHTLGVEASVYLDTNAREVVGVEMWLRDVGGEPMLQVHTIGNGHNMSRTGEWLFDGTTEEFVGLFKS